ncbi:MAG: hypothetical protein Q8Q09_28440 [Deltaproteobacteria bacterium]|nr:hypothetical protein [Deltaproteobacteria bacterium]
MDPKLARAIHGAHESIPCAVTAPSRVTIPPRAARVASLRALLGTPNRAVAPLAVGIRRTARHHFDRHVVPQIRLTWPALFAEPFYEKLTIGACDLYASAPYTALFCAPHAPAVVRAMTAIGDALPLSDRSLALLGRGAIEGLGRFALAEQHRRIALISAFIVVVDHVFDHCMDDAPKTRGARLEAVIEGRIAPDSPPLALTRALTVAMSEGLDAIDRPIFQAALARVFEWIRAEVKAMLGEPDPRGLGHRLAGVEGTIDGLLFPVIRTTGESARQWMYDVSLFVQIMDDWLDYESDVRSDRATPVMTGAWAMPQVESAWNKTVVGIEDLVRASGSRSPRYVRFIRDAYKLMMHEVTEAMIERPDA